ncbi:hypothetical protein H1R20_g1130, partial [Candolleomyces eurysporus]
MASLHAGVPVKSSINTVNTRCLSGLSAITQIANEIKAGQIEIGIGAGVESMTNGCGSGTMASVSNKVLTNPGAEGWLLPMGITSKNFIASYNVTHVTNNAFAARCFQNAAATQKFKDEIVPMGAKPVDPKTEEKVLAESDDGIRDSVTPESLGKLTLAFKKDGSRHARDAAVLFTKRSVSASLSSARLSLVPSLVSLPRSGVGPAYAISRALGLLGLSLKDIDSYEIDEAFAN